MYSIEIDHEVTWISVEGQFLTLYDVIGHTSEASNFAPMFFASHYWTRMVKLFPVVNFMWWMHRGTSVKMENSSG